MSASSKLSPDAAHALRPFHTVSVIGLGYIGLPTAAILAARGIPVHGVDVSPHVVDTINRGEIHIVEPLLDLTVRGAVQSGCLKAMSAPIESDAFLIAVPTPLTPDKRADLSFVMAAADSIAPVLKHGDLVILESTCPVGATEQLVDRLINARPDLTFPVRGDSGVESDISVAYCPERVLPGRVVEELVSNDRAIGGVTPACSARAIALYRLFVRGDLLPTDSRSAELCKLSENAYRDVNIAFANELANISETLNVNVWEVIALANRHPRVSILSPGPGVGGHCIAVDPWFIAEAAPDDTPVIKAARGVNDQRPTRVFDRIRTAARTHERTSGGQPVIALLGLAFKPNIDDTRESPAVEVARLVATANLGETLVVEPHVKTLPTQLRDCDVTLEQLDQALRRSDIVVLLVNHAAFSDIEHQFVGNVLISECREMQAQTNTPTCSGDAE